MKTELEILEELEERINKVLERKFDTYNSYRSNKNFCRGMLWCLGMKVPANITNKTIELVDKRLIKVKE